MYSDRLASGNVTNHDKSIMEENGILYPVINNLGTSSSSPSFIDNQFFQNQQPDKKFTFLMNQFNQDSNSLKNPENSDNLMENNDISNAYQKSLIIPHHQTFNISNSNNFDHNNSLMDYSNEISNKSNYKLFPISETTNDPIQDLNASISSSIGSNSESSRKTSIVFKKDGMSASSSSGSLLLNSTNTSVRSSISSTESPIINLTNHTKSSNSIASIDLGVDNLKLESVINNSIIDNTTINPKELNDVTEQKYSFSVIDRSIKFNDPGKIDFTMDGEAISAINKWSKELDNSLISPNDLESTFFHKKSASFSFDDHNPYNLETPTLRGNDNGTFSYFDENAPFDEKEKIDNFKRIENILFSNSDKITHSSNPIIPNIDDVQIEKIDNLVGEKKSQSVSLPLPPPPTVTTKTKRKPMKRRKRTKSEPNLLASVSQSNQIISSPTTTPSTPSSPTNKEPVSKIAKVDMTSFDNISIASNNPAKPFQCTKCVKSFRRQEHLKRHFRSVHSTERPFECSFCDKKFSRSDNLAQHLRTHNRGRY